MPLGCEECEYSKRIPRQFAGEVAYYDIVCECPNFVNGRHLCGASDPAQVQGGQI